MFRVLSKHEKPVRLLGLSFVLPPFPVRGRERLYVPNQANRTKRAINEMAPLSTGVY